MWRGKYAWIRCWEIYNPRILKYINTIGFLKCIFHHSFPIALTGTALDTETQRCIRPEGISTLNVPPPLSLSICLCVFPTLQHVSWHICSIYTHGPQRMISIDVVTSCLCPIAPPSGQKGPLKQCNGLRRDLRDTVSFCCIVPPSPWMNPYVFPKLVQNVCIKQKITSTYNQ